MRAIWIVAFSGYLSSSDTEHSVQASGDFSAAVRCALHEFLRHAQSLDGSLELITSAAEGADQIAIGVAESLGLSIHIILPMPIAEFAVDFQDRPQAWDLTLAAIAKAGGLVGLGDEFVSAMCTLGERGLRTLDWPPLPVPGWTFRVSSGCHERDNCYHDCRTQMLEAADALITIENTEPQNNLDPRGTVDVVEQAKARGLAVAFCNTTDRAAVNIQWHTEPWQADPIMSSIGSAIAGGKCLSQTTEPLSDIFAALDERALQTGGRLKHHVTTVIGLQFSATILAAINSALLLPRVSRDLTGIESQWDPIRIGAQILFGLEFVFVLVALFIGVNSRWSKLKSTWRQTRFAAEVLRSLQHARNFIDPLYPIVSRRDQSWHRFALSSGLLARRSGDGKALNWEEAKEHYHRHRIEHQCQAYFQKQLVAASKLSAVCGNIAMWSGAIAPIGLMCAWYVKFVQPPWLATDLWSAFLVRFLPILLPLLAGTATSLRVVTDAGRRAERYKTQANRLQALSNLFPVLQTPYSIRRAVTLTEEILLDELVEWHAASKNTGK